jgi:hypothetical protein
MVIVLEIEIACSQWEGAASTQGPQLFNLGFGAEGERGFYLYLFIVADLFPPCSQVVPQVLNVFPKGVPNSWVGGWRGGFCFKLYLSGLSNVHLDSGQWTFHASFIREGGEDLFSFQPMGRPKVPCFYSF